MHNVRKVRTARGTITPAGTTEAVLDQTEFPAYFWTAGKVVRASFASTVIDQNSTDTITNRLRFGGDGSTLSNDTAIAASAAIDAADGDVHVANVEIVCRSITSAGVGTFFARAIMNDPDATGTVPVDGYVVAEIGSIDTRDATFLTYSAQWSVSHADNDAACDYALVEEITAY